MGKKVMVNILLVGSRGNNNRDHSTIIMVIVARMKDVRIGMYYQVVSAVVMVVAAFLGGIVTRMMITMRN